MGVYNPLTTHLSGVFNQFSAHQNKALGKSADAFFHFALVPFHVNGCIKTVKSKEKSLKMDISYHDVALVKQSNGKTKSLAGRSKVLSGVT